MALIGRLRKTALTGADGPRPLDDGPWSPDDGALMSSGPVGRALRLTRLAMIWERAAQAFWPLATLLAAAVAALLLGLIPHAGAALPWLVGAWLSATIAAGVLGGLRYRRVHPGDVVARLDRTLPGRPLTALDDRAALGDEGALWRAHLAQMRAVALTARPVPPRTELARRDPYALRLAGLVALVMALIFGGPAQMGEGLRAIAATVSAPPGTGQVATGPSWEGWAEPPAYTRRPTLYLNALPEGEGLILPKGTVLSFRIYGGAGNFRQDVGPVLSDDPAAPRLRAEADGTVELDGRRFQISVLPDLPPVIRAGSAPQRRADGRMIQDFSAEDDHGIVAADAVIQLDLPAVDRRFGLSVPPEPREAIELPLPMPRGDRRRIEGQMIEDLARHPWANLPVTLTLRAEDGIEQVAHAGPARLTLPGRRFFNPLAAALVEMRRDLLWSRENAPRTAEILRAVTWAPEGFVETALYDELRGAVSVLERPDAMTAQTRDRLSEALWQAALQLEDGGLADALARMRDAQERLSEAIRQGASPDEIQRLMDELREATDAYTRMLAEQSQREDQTDSPDRRQQGQQITGDQIQQMMDEIQRLMNEGRMAEAQALLDQFNRMMENLQVQQSQGGEGGGEGSGQGSQPMNRLADTLREQQRLSDEAFREMQRRFGEGGSGGADEAGPDGAPGDLADRQRELRDELGRQRGLLPGQGSEPGDRARRDLDEAGRAMEDAERALRGGDAGEALQRQADAIQSMREGMRALGEMLSGDRPDTQPGQQGGDEDQQAGEPGDAGSPGAGRADRQGRPQLDPLGRQRPGSGNVITGGDPLAEGLDPARRARDLLDEIRRRSGDMSRPRDERDYLGRLLDRF